MDSEQKAYYDEIKKKAFEAAKNKDMRMQDLNHAAIRKRVKANMLGVLKGKRLGEFLGVDWI